MKTLTADCVLDAKAVLGEGPVWRAETQDLVWVDIESARVCCFNPATGENQTWDVGEKPGLAVPTKQGDLILGTSVGFVRLDLASGVLSPIIDPEQDLPNNRFNDGKVDPEGRLWAGTMGLDEAPNVGSLYRLNRNLSTDKLFDQVTISNGMAWTSDQKTFYYIDSPTRRVDVFDCDMAGGTVSDRRTAFELPEGMGYPDGMSIDNEGMLWVALWQGWGVARFAPGGALLAKVEVPVECVTSCCFGGENWDELYITTSSRDLDETGRAEQPLAGGLFRCRPGVSGPPTNLFLG
ncbi:MAG: SMP-30/gluconolactonase/LRE family protein [Verrucomicrobiota bacterium]|nr:SMP-30/gluconolactonase/LRE family protein [Verrucomicrobiota bacterium]